MSSTPAASQAQEAAAPVESGGGEREQEVELDANAPISQTRPANDTHNQNNNNNDQQAKLPPARRKAQAASEPTVAKSRAPRIYRIRAAGANGHFGPPVVPRAHVDEQAPGSGQEKSPPTPTPPEVEAESAEADDKTTTLQPPRGQFGVRQRTARVLKPQQQQQQEQNNSASKRPRNCAHEQLKQSIDGETAAEASSISASSQTLRLNVNGGGGGNSRLAPHLLSSQVSHLQGAKLAKGQEEQADEVEQQDNAQQDNQAAQASRGESILSLIDQFDSHITTNKTQAQLSCDSGEMVVRLNFSEPFRGVVYPDHNRLSPCRFFGDGHRNYELRLPLRGCGTRQVAPRVFANDVIVRFHKTLELEEDEVKTLICRYPPPMDMAAAAAGGGGGLSSDRQRERLAPASDVGQTSHELVPLNRSQLEQQQFELLLPELLPGRPTNRLGAGGGQQEEEFASGQLLAPSSGPSRNYSPQGSQTLQELQQRQQSLLRARQQQQQQRQSANLIQASVNPTPGKPPPLWPFGDISSANETTASFQPNQTTSGAPNFLERLTSVELLFLISSLMFLVLLALGLAGSYWCFWRGHRRTDRRRNVLASVTSGAVGGARRKRARKLRYFNAPHLGPAGGQRLAYGLGGGGGQPNGGYLSTSGAHISAPYGQPQPQPLYYSGGQYLGRQQPAQAPQLTQAPSSPDDSDISNQLLLLPGNSSNQPRGGRQAQHYDHTTHMPPSGAPSQHYKATTIGRKFLNQKMDFDSTATGRRQTSMLDAQTLGRGRRQGYLASNLAHTNRLHEVARGGDAADFRHAHATLNNAKANTLGGRQSAREPLLKLASSGGELPRAQVAQLPADASRQVGELLAWQRHQQQLARLNGDPNRLFDGTVRSQAAAHEYRGDGGEQEQNCEEQEAFVEVFERKQRRRQRVPTSESREFEEGHEQQSESQSDDDEEEPPPRLILQNIEDSFVTKLTEISEQEYLKYDDRKPLNWSEWTRARTQAAASSLRRAAKEESAQESGEDGASSASEASSTTQTSAESTDTTRRQTSGGNGAGLRSLTEVDVNFAKTLPRKSAGSESGASAGALVSPEVAQSGPNASTSAKLETPDTPTPDLIISPEYNFGRFKLVDGRRRPPGVKSPAGESHESISYV